MASFNLPECLKERHDFILQTFILNQKQSRYKRDIDVIREHHRFLWSEGNEKNETETRSWEENLARRYYDKLFKEYCIADLTRYTENKIALRWRTEAEVVTGKGQFQCGSRKCDASEELRSWEVNFGYLERGEKKNALVKLRLCPDHSAQLNFTSKKREVKRLKYVEKQKRREEKQQKKLSKKKKKGETLNSNDTFESVPEPEESSSNGLVDDSAEDTHKAEDDGDIDENLRTTSEVDNIWNKKPEIEVIETRESDFERYLEDMLL